MTALSQDAQKIVDAFGEQPGMTPERRENLRKLLESNPSLVERINLAAERGELRSIETGSSNGDAVGSYDYDRRRMTLSLSLLDAPPGSRDFNPYPAAGIIGHELGHAAQGEVRQREYAAFNEQVERIARSPGPVHDYTQPIVDYVDASRKSEAVAEIAAFNAVAAALRDRHGRPGLDQIYEAYPERMRNFIDKDPNGPPHVYTMKPGFTIGADSSLATTPGNIEAAAIRYYDRNPNAQHGAGQSEGGDYRHQQAAAAIGYAAQREIENNPRREGETAPRFTVALAEVGVNEAALERNGIDLGSNNRPPLAYYDSSTDPPTQGWFDHTAPHAQGGLGAPPLPPGAATIAAPASEHPDHSAYARIRDGVERLDAGRGTGEIGERLTLAALARWKENGGGPLDHAVLSSDRSTLFLVQGRLDDPAHRRVAVPVAEALNASLAQPQQRADTDAPPAQARAQETIAEPTRAPAR